MAVQERPRHQPGLHPALTPGREHERDLAIHLAEAQHGRYGGTYRLSSTFQFGPQDSGTNGHTVYLDSFGDTSNAGRSSTSGPATARQDQELQFVATSGGYGELQVENSGQDVTVLNSSTAQGTPDIVQEPVNGNAASQWLPSQSDGSWQFQNKNSGLCLDVYGDSSKTGQQLEQWTCKNGLVTTRAAS